MKHITCDDLQMSYAISKGYSPNQVPNQPIIGDRDGFGQETPLGRFLKRWRRLQLIRRFSSVDPGQ